MTTSNTTRLCRTDSDVTRQAAESFVGHRIRVHRADGWNPGQWATITMVVISRDRLCWLVEYFNGAHDVVPIFDNPDHYDLAH